MNEENQTSASWQDLSDQLVAHFDNTAQHRCLLWVDPAQGDRFAGSQLVERLRARIPIRHPRFDVARAPYLVPLDLSRSDDAALFANSVELAWLVWSTEYLRAMQGQPICGWVSTRASATALARHWGANCHLHVFQRQSRLLRFQDPGVREWLWPSLDQTQRQAMLGPALEIASINRAQQLVHYASAESAISASAFNQDGPTAFPRLRIDAQQWMQIDDYAVLHAAWLTWRSSSTATATITQAPGWERPLLRALAHAINLGIRDASDRELFALHALQLGPSFHQHPKLDDIWPRTQAGEFYSSAVEFVTGRPADQLAL